MKKSLSVILLFAACAPFVFAQVDELKKAQDKRKDYITRTSEKPTYFSKTPYVNPFIGTGGHGHTYPGASAPFGMMQLSPDTRYDGWDGCSGYHYSDSIIYGFSHTHLSGTGVSDYGDLLIVPQSGEAKTTPGYLDKNGYGDRFSHERESASPGYYSVHLENGDIDVQLAVTERAGIHTYKFNKAAGKKFILLDLDHRDKVLSAGFDIIDKRTIQGHRVSHAWATEQHFYFHLKLDRPYDKAQLIEKNGVHKLLLTFPETTQELNITVGMSSVDTKGAQKNLEAEIPVNSTISSIRAKVTKAWNDELDKIHFKSADKEVMTIFYTALYHSFLAPNLFSDVDGRYRGLDKEIHQLTDENQKQYTVFSLWDTYRAAHPLFTLTQVERTNQFINTFLRQYEQGGDLPVWELAGNETECMIGYHSVSVIADAYMKGIRDYPIDRIINAMIATTTFDEFGKIQFHKEGYIDAGDEPESVSKSLEYAYDDFCISTMIAESNKLTGKSLENPFEHSSYNFINHFDPTTGFMRARRSGQWFSPFDPAEVNFNYTEANSWQYSLYAPHAVGVLRDLLGGKDSLETWLDRLFTTEMVLTGRHQVDITGLVGQYAHGNEPSHHMAYLYNYTNRPHKTQKYTSIMLNTMYQNAPDGLSGNEDCGQMSAWYVMSSLGLYQIAPGNPYYELTRPIVDEAIIQLENNNILKIRTIGNELENVFIKDVYFNGRPLEGSFIAHDTLMKGGELVFELIAWPTEERMYLPHAPTIEKIPATFIALPYFEQTQQVFIDTLSLSLATFYPEDAVIHYTIDGTEPTTRSPIFSKPIDITETTTIKAFSRNEHATSAIIFNQFIKKDNGVSLKLDSEYANQYSAGGPFSLIDGIRGKNELRTGDWQGFWDQDVVAEVTFDGGRALSTVGLSCLSDMKSWVFFPKEIRFEISTDGVNFTALETVKIQTEQESNMYSHHKEFSVKTNTTEPIQKIRVTAVNFGKCPEWHLGIGNPTWLFVDEIVFK